MQSFIMPFDRNTMLDDLHLEGWKCVEVGTYLGEYAKQILLRNPAELWLVDPWEKQPHQVYPNDDFATNEGIFKMEDLYAHVTSTYGPDPRVRILRKKSFEAAPEFKDGSMNLVYVDAIHTFESCFMDVVTWWPKVISGGWLCGHDYNGAFIGVRNAVDTFCRLTEQPIALMTKESEWASWGIRKP